MSIKALLQEYDFVTCFVTQHVVVKSPIANLISYFTDDVN